MTRTEWLKKAGLPTHRPPTSPGDMVREFLADLAVSQAGAARALKISTNRLNEIAQNKRGITTDTALRLAAYFGTSPQFWLNVQAAWDLWHDLQQDTTTYQAIERHRPAAAADSVNSWQGDHGAISAPMLAARHDGQ